MFEDYQSVVGYPNLSENQTLNVVTDAFQYTYEISEVIFESWKSGTWNLALTGLNPLWYMQPSGAVEVAWKDINGDNQWHVFVSGQNVMFGFYTNIILYSGSASISYRIRLANQNEVGGPISVTPLFLY
jgi:hypothetical protein